MPSLPLLTLPPIDEAAWQRVEAELGDDWDDAAFSAWLAQDPSGSAQRLKAWGALDMQFEDEHYGCGGWSPLMMATSIEDRDARRVSVAALIAEGANVRARTQEGTSVLGIAMMTGDATVVDALLAAGADPTVTTVAGLTPLHHVTYGHGMGRTTRLTLEDTPHRLAKALLDAGADPNAATFNEGTTPLQFIVGYHPDLPTVELLVARGADLHVRAPDAHRTVVKGVAGSAVVTVDEGSTLLHLVAGHPGEANVVRGLVALGLDVNAVNDAGTSVLGVMLEATAWGRPGTLWFDEERQGQHLDVLYALLDAGANPNAANHEGVSPWHSLVDTASSSQKTLDGSRMAVQAMVDAGADLHTLWIGEGGGEPQEEVAPVTCLQRLASMAVLNDAEHARWIEGLEVRAVAVSVRPSLPAGRPRPRL